MFQSRRRRVLGDHGRLCSRAAALGALLLVFASLSGCIDIAERSFPLRPEALVRLVNSDRVATRDWTPRMHQAALPLLPAGRNEALTTGELADGDKPRDVWKRFNLHPENLDNIFLNLRAIEQSAQTVSPTAGVAGKRVIRGPWEGFADVDVPANGAVLWGRLGVPEKAFEIPGSYVIITHGLFGTMDGCGPTNQAQALRRAGHHVLAIEMRGHGQTALSHPEYAITFGVQESRDLLETARWLKAAHGAQRVGLASFSLTGYEALLTAWLDGQSPVTDFADTPLGTVLPPRGAEPAFNGGMFLVSTPIGLMEVGERFERRVNLLESPVMSIFQRNVGKRLKSIGQGPGYTMWDLARGELRHGEVLKLYPSFEAARPDFTRFLDLSRDNWREGAARMENIRVPVLVLNAANDPLGLAQSVANLFSRQRNPNIGVVLLKEGGHIGLTAYSADYYYSLMVNFFDPATAPVAVPPAPRPAERAAMVDS